MNKRPSSRHNIDKKKIWNVPKHATEEYLSTLT